MPLPPEHASHALPNSRPRIRWQSESSMFELGCLTLATLAVTSQTSVVRLKILSYFSPLSTSLLLIICLRFHISHAVEFSVSSHS